MRYCAVLICVFFVYRLSVFANGQEQLLSAAPVEKKVEQGVADKLSRIISDVARSQGQSASIAGLLSLPTGEAEDVVLVKEVSASKNLTNPGKKTLAEVFSGIRSLWIKQREEVLLFSKDLEDLESQSYLDKLASIRKIADEEGMKAAEKLLKDLDPNEQSEVCRIAVKKSLNAISSDFVVRHLEISSDRAARLKEIFENLNRDFRNLPKRIPDKAKLVVEIRMKADMAYAECLGVLTEEQLDVVTRWLNQDGKDLTKSLTDSQRERFQAERKRWIKD